MPFKFHFHFQVEKSQLAMAAQDMPCTPGLKKWEARTGPDAATSVLLQAWALFCCFDMLVGRFRSEGGGGEITWPDIVFTETHLRPIQVFSEQVGN